MKLYIPTVGRIDKQITFDHLPKKWQERTELLTNEEETEILRSKGYPAVHCPAQGSLARVRNWVADKYATTNQKYGVLDDDLIEFCYTARPSERDQFRLVNTPINGPRLEPGFESYFDQMMDWVDKTLDEVSMCSVQTTWIPPFEEDYKEPFRQSGNHFYNAKTFPKDLVDFEAVKCAEDFYCVLQLCSHGFPNRVSQRWRVRPANTADAGGCDTYRTIEMHNESMKTLKEMFPNYVSLNEKVAKVGEWGGIPKLAANIQWKKCLKDSINAKGALDDLFA